MLLDIQVIGNSIHFHLQLKIPTTKQVIIQGIKFQRLVKQTYVSECSSKKLSSLRKKNVA